MVPTLVGRIQTRIFLLTTIGSAVTALITPVLPITGPVGASYRITFTILGTVIVLGIGWELVYHLLMQFRWEKDWPSMFGLLTGVPEAVLIWVLLVAHAVPGIATRPPVAAYVIDFGVVWICVWLVANGPMRVPFLRWRFRGGRLV